MTRRPGKLRQNNPTLRALARAMDASGMTQNEISRRSGVSQAFISNIRTGSPKATSFVLLEAVANTVGLEFKLERKHNGTE